MKDRIDRRPNLRRDAVKLRRNLELNGRNHGTRLQIDEYASS